VSDTSAAGDIAASFGLGPIDQISFAVEDMDAALPAYTALFGEFTVRRAAFTPERVRYLGKPATATLVLAIARSGDLEIELVEVRQGEGPAKEHIRQHGHGLHHVRFPVEDLDAKRAELEAAGFATILYGTTRRGSVFAYLEAPAMFGHTQFELIQKPPAEG
jgi:methylmalonyl-CoA/ethylmalonyl-CoA epimerase